MIPVWILILLSFIAVIPCLIRWERTGDLFEPLFLLSVVYLIRIPASAGYLYYMTFNNESALIEDYRVWLWLSISVTVVAFTYYLCIRYVREKDAFLKYVRPQVPRWLIERSVILYCVTVIIRIVTLKYRYGTWFVGQDIVDVPNILGTLGQFHRIAYLIVLSMLTWNNIYRKNRAALVIIITSVCELGLQIYEGSKAAAITSLLPVAFFISRQNKRQKWSQLTLLLLICLLFVFIFPYVDAVRNDRDYVLVGYDFAGNLAARLCWLPNLALIISAIPRSIPYWHGASVWPAFTWFIPRIIWPGKPVLSIGSWFAKTFLNWSEGSLSEAAITIWGDAYLNFGFPGIVFISIFLGISYAYAYKRWYLRGRTALDYVIYWVFISELILGLERNIAAIIGALFQQILVVLVLWVVLRVRLPRSKGSIPV